MQFDCITQYGYNPQNRISTSTSVCISTGTVQIASDTLPLVVNGFTAGEVVISVFLFVLLLQALAYKLLKLLKII